MIWPGSDRSDNQTAETSAVRRVTNIRWYIFLFLLATSWTAFPAFMEWLTYTPATWLHDLIVTHWK